MPNILNEISDQPFFPCSPFVAYLKQDKDTLDQRAIAMALLASMHAWFDEDVIQLKGWKTQSSLSNIKSVSLEPHPMEHFCFILRHILPSHTVTFCLE
jgi:hypothetical protein